MAISLTSICLLQAALKSGVHRARFGVRQTPGLSQVRNHNNIFERRKESKYDHNMRSPLLLQSQSEQSGSEQDSAVESPLVDSVDSDSQQVVIFDMDVISLPLLLL